MQLKRGGRSCSRGLVGREGKRRRKERGEMKRRRRRKKKKEKKKKKKIQGTIIVLQPKYKCIFFSHFCCCCFFCVTVWRDGVVRGECVAGRRVEWRGAVCEQPDWLDVPWAVAACVRHAGVWLQGCLRAICRRSQHKPVWLLCSRQGGVDPAGEPVSVGCCLALLSLPQAGVRWLACKQHSPFSLCCSLHPQVSCASVCECVCMCV